MRNNWEFHDYMGELIYLAEISEIPGVKDTVQIMLTEVWAKFPEKCENNFVVMPKKI